MITAERLRELLHYDPETGEFLWKIRRRGVRASSVAGYARPDGYRRIVVDGGRYMAHRLAWLYMKGTWPAEEVDHDNLIRNDNRWDNLREATTAQNKGNCTKRQTNTSGFKGVSWHAIGRKWRASIQVNNRHIYLGLFDDINDAAAAYADASEKYHGEFGRVA